MNRFYSIFMVVAASCSFAFAQTNIMDIQLIGSGEYPTNYAANVENEASLNVSGSTLTGGNGGTTTETASIITMNGGAGLRGDNVDSVSLTNTAFNGGNGGTVTVSVSSTPEANAGHGVDLSVSSGSSDLSLSAGVVATGGNGGTLNNGDGKAKVYGGDGVHVGVFNDASADIVVAEGAYQGGNGGATTFNSTEKVDFLTTIISGNLNGARGGHGLYVFEDLMFRDVARSLTITNGSFSGGAGGSALNNSDGDVIADGGSGIFIGSVSDVNIFGGTFVGGAAGSTNGVAANGGFGATFWDSNVEISGGDFQGDGGGVLFSSVYYDSTATISSGRFDSVEFRAITTDIPGFQGSTTGNISGGDFGAVKFSGAEDIDATLTGGTVGELNFAGDGARNLSIADATTVSSVVQDGGTANFSLWSDHHFMDTTINSGTMNFSGQGFNLTDGSSLALLNADSTMNFNDGFTAQSGSQITTMYDGTTHSTITGGAMVFEAGAKWTINGVSTILGGDEITLASGSSMTSGLLDTDVEYLGGSWAAGLTVDVVANDLIGTYGFLDLQDSLGLDENDGGYGTAMAQFSALTGFADSDEYTEIKGLPSVEAANTVLIEQFNNNAMVGAVMQLQGVFADQIQDRTRSHLRYKDSTSQSRSPNGARGPDARSTLKSMDENAPSWDVSQSMRNMDDNAPRWDVSQSMRNVDDKAPKSAGDSIKIPATYQVWGRGYGSYFKQGDTSDQVGYDGTVGGGVLGLDKRFNNVLLGLGGGYANTRLNGNGGSEDSADTFYGTAYAGMAGEKGFFDFNLNYAFNEIESEGSAAGGNYSSEYDASTFGMYLGGGWGFAAFNDSVLFTPEASLLTTYYTRDSYTEKAAISLPTPGGSPDLAWDDYDQWSYLSSLGATLSMIHQIENFNLEMEFQPEIRAHWLHEFNADMDDDSYHMGGLVTPVGVAVRAREEDLVKVGAGVRFSKWGSDTLEFGLDVDGVFGSDYEAYILSGKLLHRF